MECVKIIAGLGNPGRKYSDTRHNTGWMALERLAAQCGGTEEECCGGLVIRRRGLWLFKPLSYVNLSGPPVARLCEESGVSLEDLLILADDLNLGLGAVRLRPGGSSGGHRGLASLIEALGTEEFPRLRMGIGPCPPEADAREFVLSGFAPEEWDVVENMTGEAARAAVLWAREGIQTAMNQFNRKLRDEEQP